MGNILAGIALRTKANQRRPTARGRTPQYISTQFSICQLASTIFFYCLYIFCIVKKKIVLCHNFLYGHQTFCMAKKSLVLPQNLLYSHKIFCTDTKSFVLPQNLFVLPQNLKKSRQNVWYDTICRAHRFCAQ